MKLKKRAITQNNFNWCYRIQQAIEYKRDKVSQKHKSKRPDLSLEVLINDHQQGSTTAID